MTYIYLLVSQNDSQRYIGVTNNPRKRLYEHRRKGKDWIDKMLILDTSSSFSDAIELEKKYIDFWKQLGPLKNKNHGGGGVSYISLETKIKIIETLKGNKRALGFKHSKETREKYSQDRAGSFHPLARLSEKQVKEIRELYKDGLRQTAIGKLYNISRGHADNIVHRRAWKHI